MQNSPELLSGYSHLTHLPVVWSDQDLFAHVNNLVYLRWAEHSRVEYLLRVGLWRSEADGHEPILARLEVDYRRPVLFPGSVSVGTRVTRIGNTSFQMNHIVVCEDFIAAEVDSVIVMLDIATKRPVRVPGESRRLIAAIEGWPAEAGA
jgi:acyl-CoA thioester hydrolase